jgi:tRNA nucleotidyltransferase (CCA-adding enzyme)
VGYVTHDVVADFAVEKVNLKRDAVTDYRQQVQRLRDRLKEHIDAHPDYGFVKTRHSGSLAKGTALSSLNDMDLAVYVKAGEAPAAENALLRWLEERLKEALKPMGLQDDQFVRQTHCVKIEYRGSGLNVDVVPVIYEGEADDVGYLISQNTGARIRTSVTQHLQFIRTRKGRESDFTQVVRLCKWWVRQVKRRDPEFRCKSFMIELICAHLVDAGVEMSDYPRALERFFAYIVKGQLRERIAFDDFYGLDSLPSRSSSEIEILDPVNAENNVAALYDSAHREQIVEAAHDALDAISEALYADGKGRAVDLWKPILGPSFSG